MSGDWPNEGRVVPLVAALKFCKKILVTNLTNIARRKPGIQQKDRVKPKRRWVATNVAAMFTGRKDSIRVKTQEGGLLAGCTTGWWEARGRLLLVRAGLHFTLYGSPLPVTKGTANICPVILLDLTARGSTLKRAAELGLGLFWWQKKIPTTKGTIANVGLRLGARLPSFTSLQVAPLSDHRTASLDALYSYFPTETCRW